ncbi:hypothetical protein QOZ80_5AG0383870 [Eleusine coracana subsp. coracana]|nr:hypothetical protein QOZ80_5AG0383870 [Eleusine coracana subsp. coracana]
MNIISQVQVSHVEQPDILCWQPATSGQCTSKEAYRLLATQHQQPIPQKGSRAFPPQVLNLLQVVWKHKTLQPKYKTFSWRLLRQALATGERAGKYSSHISKYCSTCGLLETDAHLFFECTFARAVWFAGSIPLCSSNLPGGQQGVQAQLLHLLPPSTSPTNLQQIIITIWHLWKARNDKRFDRKNWTAMQVHWATKAVLKDAQVNDEPPLPLSLPPLSLDRNLTNRSARTTNRSTVSLLPCTSESMCRRTSFTDAALPLSHQVNMPNRAGIGVFITMPGAACPTIAAIATAQHAASALQAEAMAILLASKMLKALNFTEITYATDSQILANTLQQDDFVLHPGEWRLRPLLYEFKNNNKLINYSVIKVHRDNNTSAHQLAASAIRSSASSQCVYSCSHVAHNQQCPVLDALQSVVDPKLCILFLN